jgi:hypothetical protein
MGVALPVEHFTKGQQIGANLGNLDLPRMMRGALHQSFLAYSFTPSLPLKDIKAWIVL